MGHLLYEVSTILLSVSFDVRLDPILKSAGEKAGLEVFPLNFNDSYPFKKIDSFSCG